MLRKKNDIGIAVIWLAVILLPLVSFLALAVDTGLLLSYRQQQQNNAEYSALAALRGKLEFDGQVVPKAKAADIAGQNFYVTRDGVQQVERENELVDSLSQTAAGSVEFGRWNHDLSVASPAPCVFEPTIAVPAPVYPTGTTNLVPAVRVRLHSVTDRTMQAAFARIFGIHDLSTTTEGIAWAEKPANSNAWIYHLDHEGCPTTANSIPTLPATGVPPTTQATPPATFVPTVQTTVEPTINPTEVPTEVPTYIGTADPTIAPTAEPTIEPTALPTEVPTADPSVVPTVEPTIEILY